MKTTTIPAATLLAAALVLGSAAAAPAVVLRVDDRRADVWQGTDSQGATTWEKSGTQVNTDLERSVVQHRRNNIVLVQRFRNLRRTGEGLAGVWWIKTDQPRRFVAAVNTGPDDTVGQVYVGAGRASARVAGRSAAAGPPRRPEGSSRGSGCEPTHAIDYRDETITIVVPRLCVDEPAWIKVQPYTQSVADDRYYVDNGHDAGHTFRGWTRRIERGRPSGS